jgi:hypothetical protein
MNAVKTSLALSLVSGALVAVTPAHAQTPPRAIPPYQVAIPGTKVTFLGVTPVAGGIRMYAYDLNHAGDTGTYYIKTGFRTTEAVLNDNGANFSNALGFTGEPPVQQVTAHRKDVWVVEWTTDGGFPGCEIEAGTAWKRLTIDVDEISSTCRTARAEVTTVFQAVSAIVGRHSTAGIPALPPIEPPQVPAPAPAPTATPVPQPQNLVHLAGDQNTESDTFTANGPFTISWSASVEDTTDRTMRLFALELYSASGQYLDLVANTTRGGSNTFAEHADCSGGCYFKVTRDNMSYDITAS